MTATLVPTHEASSLIITIREHRVILDVDLAKLYGVPTRTLNQAVKRNKERFPEEFMFQLTAKEWESLRSQIVTSNKQGGRRYLPYAFTEHGALMAANILQSRRAMQMSVAIVQAFVRLRKMTLSIEQLSRKVNELEQGFRQHGQQFEMVFEAIRELMTPPEPSRKKIGFGAEDSLRSP